MYSKTLNSSSFSTLQPQTPSPFTKPFQRRMPISIISIPLLLCSRISSYATEHRVVPLSDWLEVGRKDSAGQSGLSTSTVKDESYGKGGGDPGGLSGIEEGSKEEFV